MIRLFKERTVEQQHEAQGSGVTLFCNTTQRQRIEVARYLLTKAISECKEPKIIYELGCGAGEISGPFSHIAKVTGVEIIPAALKTCKRLWPNMTLISQPVEQIEPAKCSVLVMCEFLEHILDPISLVQKWLPRAEYAVIGHPLNEPDPPFEKGHCWSYSWEDYLGWLGKGGHELIFAQIFPVPPCYPTAVYGLSKRKHPLPLNPPVAK